MHTNGPIFIGDLPSAVVFAALYNNAVVKGFASRTSLDGHMSIAVAQAVLNNRTMATFIQEWGGRIIGIDFSDEEFDPTVYNTANGGAGVQLAQRVVAHVRQVLTPELLADATRDFWVPVPAEAS